MAKTSKNLLRFVYSSIADTRMLLTSELVLLVVSLNDLTMTCGTDAASVKQDMEDNVTAAYYYMQCAYQVPENNMATPFNAVIISKNYVSD